MNETQQDRDDRDMAMFYADQQKLESEERATVARAVQPPNGGWASVYTRVGKCESEIEVELHGRWTAAYPQTREQPGERGGFIIEEVKYEGTYLTHLFSDNQLEELERVARGES